MKGANFMIRWISGPVAAVVLALPSAALAQESRWTGFYVGANAAGSHDKVAADATLNIQQISNLVVAGRGLVVVPGTTRPLDASGSETNWFAGAQAGYQWQSGNIVFGAEAEFDPFSRNASVSQTQTLPITILSPVTTIDSERDVRINNLWSVRARLGIAFGSTLAYATGGYASARARVTSTDSFTNPGGPGAPNTDGSTFNGGPEGPVVTTARDRRNMGGWTGGLGVEQALGAHFSVALEYRHTDLGAKNFTLANQATVNTGPESHGTNGGTGLLGNVSTGPTRVSLRSDAVGLRLNFRF
jgi:outer membrane immunogenic protein